MTKLDIHDPGANWEDFSADSTLAVDRAYTFARSHRKKIRVTQLSISFRPSRIYDARARRAWCPTREGVFGDVAWRCEHDTSDLSLSRGPRTPLPDRSGGGLTV